MTNKLPLEIHELLDRYELLYPDVEELSDLRRAVIDNDIASIFRLCNPQNNTNNNEELRKAILEENLHSLFRVIAETKSFVEVEDFLSYIEDIRKSVINKNLRSIFKLLGNEELRKVCLDDNYWKLWPLLEKYTDTQFTQAFKNFYVNNIEIDRDCFSRGQLRSKLWLVEELKNCDVSLGTVYLCAGWYATLATMLFESGMKIDKVRSFDLDEKTVNIAEKFNAPWFNENWRFKALVDDINNINFENHEWQFWSNKNNRMSYPITDVPDTIINTSCEHIENFEEWYAKIPTGKLVILQSNNYFEIEEHVNCSDSLENFVDAVPMRKTLYTGEMKLEKYTRFMKIGYR